MPTKVVISYTSEEREVALRIEEILCAQGFSLVGECHHTKLGQEMNRGIRAKMRLRSLLVVILSPDRLNLKWVPYKIWLATDRTSPVRIILYLTHTALERPEYLRRFLYATSPDKLFDLCTKWDQN